MGRVEAGARRRAVVCFLPEHVEREVDAIRRRWDPAMAERIDAHLTLVHDVTDVARAHHLVAAVAARVAGFDITITDTACWGPAKWGIYLGIEDHDGGVRALHDALAAVEDPRWLRTPFRPHVTLVHGRTVTEDVAEAAWAELNGYTAAWRCRIAALHVVESRPGGWTTIDEFELAPGPTLALD
jgi:2'-5' RNA ligase